MFNPHLQLMEIGENGNLGKTVLYNAEKVENESEGVIVLIPCQLMVAKSVKGMAKNLDHVKI